MNIRMKRHYHLIILLVFTILCSLFFLGGTRIISYTAESKTTYIPQIENIENDVDLFDNTVVHDIQILLAKSTLIDMIRTYRETGRKDYFHGDVIIDGVRVNNVGIRLKGNSTLGKIGGMKAMMEKMQERAGENGKKNEIKMPDPKDMFKDMDPKMMKNIPGFDTQMVLKVQEAIARGETPPMMDFFNSTNDLGKLSTETFPYLIRFDKFEPGRRYQGYRDIAVRSGGDMPDPSLLPEPLTNYAARLAGIPASKTSYSLVRVGGNPQRIYVIAETLDDYYVENYLPNKDGVLYKIMTGGSFNYKGDDPSAYAGGFAIKSKEYKADMAPLISFIKFISLSSDEDFERNLSRVLHIDSFVTYLAVQNILSNFDSMAGVGNNFYVYYNPATKLFQILSWDTNMSLGVMFMMSGGNGADFDLYYKNEVLKKMFQGMGNAMKDALGANTALFKRFLTIPEYKLRYENKLKELYELFFEEGVLTREVKRIQTLLEQENLRSGFTETEALKKSIDRHLEFLKNRQSYIEEQLILK